MFQNKPFLSFMKIFSWGFFFYTVYILADTFYMKKRFEEKPKSDFIKFIERMDRELGDTGLYKGGLEEEEETSDDEDNFEVAT